MFAHTWLNDPGIFWFKIHSKTANVLMKFKESNKVNAEANSQRIVIKRGINWNYSIYYACVVDPLFKSTPKIAWPKSC